MESKELTQLIIGSVIIIALFIGFSTISGIAQSGGTDAAWYRIDFYSDHASMPSATPTPQPTAVLVTVANGGTLYSNDNDNSVMVQIAPGSVITDSYIRYSHRSDAPTGELAGIDRFFSLDAQYANNEQFYDPEFSTPVTITVRYPAENILISDTINLYWLNYWPNATQWVTDGLTVTQQGVDFIQVQTTHFTDFAVLGRTNHIYLPIICK